MLADKSCGQELVVWGYEGMVGVGGGVGWRSHDVVVMCDDCDHLTT